jgi:adenylosuccinate synthase
LIAERAFAVLPSHRREDERREKGDVPIGTTGRGIGPAYQDKYARTGIRIGDFLEPDIAERLVAKGLSPDEVKEQIRLFERIRGHVVDTVTMLQTAERNGAKILLEGAQGVMLDVDFGTYPYVTSSSPNTAGGFLGTGLPIRAVNRIVGVMKAYTTRVGHGPFPTELTDAIGERLREQGREFGTTTGRARRCGWLDFAQLRFAIRVCDCTELAVMKLDVLTGLDELRFAKNYLLDGAAIEGYPARLSQLEKVVAEWDALPGWTEPVAGCRAWNQLPARATEYLRMIEKNTGCPIRTVSTSPDREDTIVLDR